MGGGSFRRGLVHGAVPVADPGLADHVTVLVAVAGGKRNLQRDRALGQVSFETNYGRRQDHKLHLFAGCNPIDVIDGPHPVTARLAEGLRKGIFSASRAGPEEVAVAGLFLRTNATSVRCP